MAPRRAKQWTESDIDPEIEAKVAQLFDRAYELQPVCDENGKTQPTNVTLSADAKALWVSYYNSHAKEQANLTGDLAAAWSKLEEAAARLALIIHFCRWAAKDTSLRFPDMLDAKSFGAGIELANWFKNEARRVYAMLAESTGDRDDRRLLEWIERRGGPVTAREVQQGCRWLQESGAADAALERLIKAERGHWHPKPASFCAALQMRCIQGALNGLKWRLMTLNCNR